MNTKKARQIKRKMKVRSKVSGTTLRPRLSVFRSNRYIYAQIIDDEKGKTIVGVWEKHLEKDQKGPKTNRARALGMMLAKRAVGKKIKQVTFDKGGTMYHGRVKALAEGAREGGLEF